MSVPQVLNQPIYMELATVVPEWFLSVFAINGSLTPICLVTQVANHVNLTSSFLSTQPITKFLHMLLLAHLFRQNTRSCKPSALPGLGH